MHAVPSDNVSRNLMRIRPFLTGTIAAAALVAAGAAAGASPLAPAPATDATTPGPPTATSAWRARVLFPVAARNAPRRGAHVLMRVLHYTEFSRTPNWLMVTGFRDNRRGTDWVRVQLPERPNGRSGWLPLDAVQLKRTDLRIAISVARRTVTLLKAGKPLRTFRAGVGTGGTPTPIGLFAVQDPFSAPRDQLGPFILVLTAHSGVLRTFAGGDGIVAIHGWPDSSVLGHAVSHGCIRMSRDDIRFLARFARAGTPVRISKS
jgi:lipoprotein-anchoring transpeptidase ErfK/SrfK